MTTTAPRSYARRPGHLARSFGTAFCWIGGWVLVLAFATWLGAGETVTSLTANSATVGAGITGLGVMALTIARLAFSKTTLIRARDVDEFGLDDDAELARIG